MSNLAPEPSGPETQSLYEKYPSISNTIGAAIRLQLSSITAGADLEVPLPDNKSVKLKVLSVGKYDPDLLEKDQFVDPSEDSEPQPGFVLDASPLDAGGPRTFMTITINSDLIPTRL